MMRSRKKSRLVPIMATITSFPYKPLTISPLILQMPIYSLTNERVQKLINQREGKESELNELLKLSAKDLWNGDLDEVAVAWQNCLEWDIQALEQSKNKKTKKTTSKLGKVSKKRLSDVDSEYMDKKPKVAKTKANTSPRAQTKITSFAKPTEAKEMHTAAFTSVNQASSAPLTLPKKSKAPAMRAFDEDEEFDSLIKGIRADQKPETIDLLSPQTAIKPKKTFSIPGIRKPSAPKPRAVSKTKAPKRKIVSDDEDDSFAFMAEDRPSAPSTAADRRPARAAASKAKAIVLTSDDVFDELDDEDEDDFDEEEDED
jgi:DNA topoisomerase II